MVGNDVIDLKLAAAQSNWKRSGWLEKIFTLKEQKLIMSSEIANTLVWQFWSMKEAVYKAHQRRFQLSRKFDPTNYECIDYTTVLTGSDLYHTRSSINHHFIYTEAFLNSTPSLVSKVFKGNKNKAKEKLLFFIKSKYQSSYQELKFITNNEGVPHLMSSANMNIPLNFSLTHHGEFSAFVISQ